MKFLRLRSTDTDHRTRTPPARPYVLNKGGKCPVLALGEAMRRRDFIRVFGGTVAAWPIAALAQQSAIPVIGIIAEVPLVEPLTAAFRRAMAELGYVEGKNFGDYR